MCIPLFLYWQQLVPHTLKTWCYSKHVKSWPHNASMCVSSFAYDLNQERKEPFSSREEK